MNIEDSVPKRSQKRRIWSFSFITVFTVILFATLFKPAMPRHIVLLTGPKNSAYHEFGVRLAHEMDTRGVKVDVVVTGGSLENLSKLSEGNNVVGLAPSVVDWDSRRADASNLVALAGVDFEPFWLFYRADLDISRISDLSGRTLATEGVQTTSHQIADLLVTEVGLAGRVAVSPLRGQVGVKSIEGFQSGTIDAVFLSGQADSASVKALLESDQASLLSLERSRALATRVSGATTVLAPEGLFDLARNVPAKDTKLLAAMTCLVADEDVAPAIVPELLAGVENISQQNARYMSTDKFPSRENVTLPLAPAAQRFFRQGEVGLSKYLPYQTVRFLNHIGFLVIPLLTALVVMLKLVPMGLRTYGRIRMKRSFRKLVSVEKGIATGVEASTLLSELNELDRTTADMFVPGAIVQDFIDFRQFLHDMRERVHAREQTENS